MILYLLKFVGFVFPDGRPAPPMKGHLRRRQEREVLAVNFTTIIISHRLSVTYLSLVLIRSLLFSSEACRDAGHGGGQRNRGVEAEAGRGQTSRGAQKVAFTQT